MDTTSNSGETRHKEGFQKLRKEKWMSSAWVDIKEDWCKACGLCLGACKLKLLQFTEHFNAHGYHPVALIEPEKCTGCTACALVCPDAAIEVYRRKRRGPQT